MQILIRSSSAFRGVGVIDISVIVEDRHHFTTKFVPLFGGLPNNVRVKGAGTIDEARQFYGDVTPVGFIEGGD